MNRIVKDRAATLFFTLQVAGEGAEPTPDEATVEIVRADGSVLVASTSALDVDDAGKFGYTLDASQTADLDNLTASWTVTFDSQVQTFRTFTQIVGEEIVPISAIQADDDLLDDDGDPIYTAEQVSKARTEAETALEQACGVAFVPRYTREVLSGGGVANLDLSWPKVRTIREASVDGSALTAGELADLAHVPNGAYWSGSVWASGTGNVIIGYEHGFDYAPAGVPRAVARLTKHYLLPSPSSDRMLRIDLDTGSATMAQPGMRGQRFGIPEVDAVIARYDFSAIVA